MTFTLDTSGTVDPFPFEDFVKPTRWSDLSPFEQGYLGRAKQAFPLLTMPDPEGETPSRMYLDWAFSDLAPSTLSEMLADCAEAEPLYGIHKDWAPPVHADAGRRFWDNRQSQASSFPPIRLTLRNDGKVYQEVVS